MSQEPLPHYLHQAIERKIIEQGFYLHHGGGPTGWSSTIGLTDQQSQHPELLIWGLSPPLRYFLFLEMVKQLSGPQSARATKKASAFLALPPTEAVEPIGGQMFEPGKLYTFAAQTFYGCFGEVELRYLQAEHFQLARAYHGSAAITVLQFVWADRYNHFPWENGCEPATRRAQVLLFDPQQYVLPLKLEEEKE